MSASEKLGLIRLVEGSALSIRQTLREIGLARAATCVDRVRVEHKPRLLSDNGLCYVAKDLGAYLKEHKIGHTIIASGTPGRTRTTSYGSVA